MLSENPLYSAEAVGMSALFDLHCICSATHVSCELREYVPLALQACDSEHKEGLSKSAAYQRQPTYSCMGGTGCTSMR